MLLKKSSFTPNTSVFVMHPHKNQRFTHFKLCGVILKGISGFDIGKCYIIVASYSLTAAACYLMLGKSHTGGFPVAAGNEVNETGWTK